MAKARQSNFELLRIVAMLMVLAIHTNYVRFGAPTPMDVANSPLPAFARILFQHLLSPCVNLFIILSGYFSIRPKVKSIANLWFLLAFWGALIISVKVVVLGSTLPLTYMCGRIIFPFIDWFIPAYLGLYLIAPILNRYVENETGADLRRYLLIFFALQTFFDLVYQDWRIFGRGIFNNGYSILSFVPTYLLGRYLKLYRPKWVEFSFRRWFASYAGIGLLISVVVWGALKILPSLGLHGANHIVKYSYCYTSPFVLLEAVCLFWAFESLNFSSRVINRIAVSVFGVFCFHTLGFFVPVVEAIYNDFSGPMVLILDLLFVIAVYIAGTLVDQVRILLWNAVSKYVFKRDGI